MTNLEWTYVTLITTVAIGLDISVAAYLHGF